MTATAAAAPTLAPAADPPRARVPRAVFWMLICVILVPIEINVRVGGLLLTASKVFLIIMTFAILPRLGQLKLRWFDTLMILHVVWSSIAFTRYLGMSDGVVRSGFYALEVLIVYLVARIYLRTLGEVLATVNMLFWMVAINALFAFPEALTGHKYVHEFARSLTGFFYPYSGEKRLGIHRSVAFFEHSILLGVFCASMLSLIWYTSRPGQRAWKVPVIFAGTFFAASSAPLMVFIFQTMLIGLERVTRGIKNRLIIITGIVAFLVVFLETASNRGFVGILSAFVVNAQTTYMRKYQWQYATDDVLSHPFFGFEPSTYTRPDWMAASIDNFWLLMMMRSGIPSLLFIFGALLLIWMALSRRERDNPPALFVNMRNGWGFMIIALLMTGSTVAFFGKLQPLFAFFISLGAALACCSWPRQDDAEPAAGNANGAAAARAPIPYTRFGPGQSPAPAVAREEAKARTPPAEAALVRNGPERTPDKVADRAKPPGYARTP